MRTVSVILLGLMLGGCAAVSKGLQTASDGVSKGVSRAPDARVDVNVK